ncbi:aquaporin AQPAe.a-like isoform X1 [Teleopsis dalmanni]|uniref:aquaporin AQPAe.a-like isoform X1 n=2 Tax=Teleopsis dalmanni TaxID=139649 RepID=UPI0018CE5DDE|nr:aquaporin AQPAe.a-like isoform X1 [Teleopsis dalmanni]
MEPGNKSTTSCLERLKMKGAVIDKISSFLGELVGTAILVFLGCMGCVKNDSFPNNHLQMVLNFGLVIMIAVQCFACVSGSHLNPAVTLAAFIYKMISLPMAAVYVVGQMLGGFIGYGLLKLVLPDNAINVKGAEHGLCVTVVHDDLSGAQGCAIEAIITGILVLVCCGVWDPRNAKFHDSVPIRFGLAVACLACSGGPFTGASMNPARSFAPALWNFDFTDHWVYWVGPLIGSAIAAYSFKIVFRREAPEEKPNNKLRAMEEVPLS